ncbi:MAG: zinc chelation protein SecC [Gammaproteobacteria bacterium]|nr:zinc chelation protein SecC [Gammaproteobacteria bacterium]
MAPAIVLHLSLSLNQGVTGLGNQPSNNQPPKNQPAHKKKALDASACPCGSGKVFARCCGRFLSGQQLAKTPEQLMRSRFTAFALGGYGDYLLASWFPATARGLSALELSERSVDWQCLEVIARSQQGDEGTVEFKAWFHPKGKSEALEAMHEVSEFRRLQGRWLYVGGRVT